jgi:hypothetical protein
MSLVYVTLEHTALLRKLIVKHYPQSLQQQPHSACFLWHVIIASRLIDVYHIGLNNHTYIVFAQ